MKKLGKKKLDLHKEAIRVLQETMLENVRGGMPPTLGPCTRTGTHG
jgi:hypothetical protein